MRTYPSLPGDVRIDAAWRALKQRADVQAEVARVGRIERYALVSSGTSRGAAPSAPVPRYGCPSLRGSARTAPSPCPHRPGFRHTAGRLCSG
ncbi:hypothetical protein G6F45_014170 [Rhizopus arrhizus]|nr:hypothetical protein G6F45_014170 [Rhizopus arrhizus]